MTAATWRKFSGEIPRLPPDRLPDGAAKIALNCNFAHGELRPLLGLGTHHLVHTSAMPCRSLWTPDGAKFFAWNKDVRAFKSPTIDDIHARVFYNVAHEGVFVTQAGSDLRLMTDEPRPPATKYRVGVRRPSGINVEVNPNAVIQVTAQLVADGSVVKEGVVPTGDVTVVEDGKTFQITLPAEWVTTVETTYTEAVPQTIAPDGFITGPARLSATLVVGDTSDTSVDPYAVATFEPGEWGINSNGLVRTASYGTVPMAGGMYNEQYYLDARLLFAELKDGTALVVAATASLQFRVKVSNAISGAVIYDEVRPHTVHPDFPNLYRVTNNVTKVDVVYVATAINIWGEESAPSDPFSIEMNDDGQNAPRVTVGLTVNPEQVPVAGVMFYRTYPGSTSTSYFLAAYAPAPDPDGYYRFTDTTTSPQTATTLQPNQAEWDEPPALAHSMCYFGNGSFIAAQGRDLVFTEPYRPHAWAYRMTLPYGIVGIIGVENGVLVTTDTHSYIISGAHPSQAAQRLLPADQAGWTSYSITRVEGAAIYASHDGLVDVFGGRPSIAASQQLFTRRDWRERYWWPAQYALVLGQHDGNILGIVVEEGLRAGATAYDFLLRLDEVQGSFCRLDLDFPLANGATVTPYGTSVCAVTDQLFITTNAGMAEFAVGPPLQYTWASGDRLYPKAINFAAGVVDCVGTVQLEIFADDTLRHTVMCDGRTYFRMPSGAPALRWGVQLVGTAVVREVSLAGAFGELKEV